MPVESVETLRTKRRQIQNALKYYEEYITGVIENGVDYVELEARFEDFRPLLITFRDIQSQIEILDESEFDNNQTRVEFEAKYFALVASSKNIAKTNPEGNQLSENSSTASTPRPRNDQIRLPKIDLPKFSGSYNDWVQFHDTFWSLIHENSSLTDVQKLHYLKSSLSGDAKNILHSLETSSSNYLIAWKLLNDRYNNQRLITKNHLRALFELPVMTKESLVILRKILDGTNRHIQALKALGRPVESWDDIIIYLISDKLDEATRKEWEGTLTREHPTLNEFLTFLEKKCQILESISRFSSIKFKAEGPPRPIRKCSNVVSSPASKCLICGENHLIRECEKFLKMSVSERLNEVKSKKLCNNCFKTGHNSFRCFSSKRCTNCHKKHNSLLHEDIVPDFPNRNSENQAPVVASNHSIDVKRNEALLSTAIVHVKAANGTIHKCRLLLDSGSQSNFIRREFAEKLRLPENKTNIIIVGVGRSNKAIDRSVKVLVSSVNNSFQFNINCLILDEITGNLPRVTFNRNLVKIPPNVKFADPEFYVSRPVDMLVGSELFWKLLCVGQVKSGSLTFQKTSLGWIIAGSVGNALSSRTLSYSNVTCEMLNKSLERFWQLDNPSSNNQMTRNELLCEDHFRKTFSRDDSGRFVVKLPFKDENPQFGESKSLALKRLHAMEKRFAKDPSLKSGYVHFIDEYIALGHMKCLNASENPSSGFYLPHHAVFKESSVTTKLRVVFDASAKSSNGVSLNDTLLVGPVLQQDLFSILVRFRFHKYVISADIVKMYRQILVADEHTRYQRILWRDDKDHEVKTYELKTVTYGTAPASFLAVRCLHQLAIEHSERYPIGAETIMRDFYVDDLLTGADSKEYVNQIKNEIIATLKLGGFELQKWSSNERKLLSDIPRHSDTTVLHFDKDETLKTLGLLWNSERDFFQFSVPKFHFERRISKRTILSEVAQVFDPLGLLNPILIKAKLLIQKMWRLKLHWDESCPLNIHTEWASYRTYLSELSDLKIPRRIVCETPKHLEIHGFCDASELAYGACVFLRSVNSDGTYRVGLLCSKSRVAPIKQISLARLELCSALLLARLLDKIHSATTAFNIKGVTYWTDSTIVLAWLNSCSRKWNTFVANRVSEIQTLSDIKSWRHVRSIDNPADILSRGCTPSQLINSDLWWFGPAWLQHELLNNDEDLIVIPDQDVPEMRKIALPVATDHHQFMNYARFSSFSKIIRIIAYCFRFAHNSMKNTKNKKYDAISHAEIQAAIRIVIKDVQAVEFEEELKDLRRIGQVSGRSKLLCLNPFLDEHQIIRVGGRLRNANVDFDTKHPMLLPSNHHITKLLIIHTHTRQFHCGLQGTLAAIRNKYWPLSARSTIRRVLKGCIRCFRFNPRKSTQVMGHLPATRVQAARPFQNCGVDYFGPLQLKQGLRKNSPIQKAYGAVFVCFATKAVHCEVVTSLSTEAFIAALKRFTARRGNVANIYSDNGTNFVGANRELKQLLRQFSNQQHVNDIMSTFAERGLKWHFIPPNSPHFGGLWEAAVKAFKRHLLKVTNNAVLQYEELHTLLIQIEAILNSRPLCGLSEDPNDLAALTPAHFLVGESLTAIPEPSLEDIPMSRLSRWQAIQKMRDHFWSRWQKEYLSQLQQRYKWPKSKGDQPVINKLVLLHENNSPPSHWKLGRIVEVHPGSDDVVRAVTVRTAGGLVRRATTKISVLPMSE